MPKELMRQQQQSAGRSRTIDVETEIVELSDRPVGELRKAWVERFQEKAPAIRSSDILLRMFAWRVQAEQFGRLDTKSVRHLRQIASVLERNGAYEPQIRRDVSPGVVLIREWKGIAHKVTVTPNGFRYQDRHYRSLSDIARTITGTRWSGPRFFGLEEKKLANKPTLLEAVSGEHA